MRSLVDGHLHIIRGNLGHVLISQRFDDINLDLGSVVCQGGGADVGAVHGEPFLGILLHGGIFAMVVFFFNLPPSLGKFLCQLIWCFPVDCNVLSGGAFDSLSIQFQPFHIFIRRFFGSSHGDTSLRFCQNRKTGYSTKFYNPAHCLSRSGRALVV